MPSPSRLEVTQTVGIQSQEMLFVQPFGVETDVLSTALDMAQAFRAAGNLSKYITHVTTHEPETTEPSLGILDRTFSIEINDRSSSAALHNVRIAPMGANRDGVLLGALRASQLGVEHGEDALNLFGGEPLEDHYDFAYATIKTVGARAGGSGYIALSGKVTIFGERPSDEQLVDLADAEAPVWASGNQTFSVCRLDITKEQAERERNYRLSQRHPV